MIGGQLCTGTNLVSEVTMVAMQGAVRHGRKVTLSELRGACAAPRRLITDTNNTKAIIRFGRQVLVGVRNGLIAAVVYLYTGKLHQQTAVVHL